MAFIYFYRPITIRDNIEIIVCKIKINCSVFFWPHKKKNILIRNLYISDKFRKNAPEIVHLTNASEDSFIENYVIGYHSKHTGTTGIDLGLLISKPILIKRS